MALAAGASFVGRSFAGDTEHLANLIKAGITHRGFALIDILQPCVSFNRKNTYNWYREKVYKLEEQSDYNPSEKLAAFARAQEWGDRIPIGLFYREERATFEEQLPTLSKGPLVRQKIEPGRVEGLLSEFV